MPYNPTMRTLLLLTLLLPACSAARTPLLATHALLELTAPPTARLHSLHVHPLIFHVEGVDALNPY
jgi:hypothetical protein